MEKSSFFNAVLDSSGVPDRPYLAESFARYFGSFIGNGVFPTPSTNLQVVADSTSMDIALKAGKGWINGYFYENTEDLTLNVPVADGVLNRIDRVVLRLDFINREIKTYVKKGTFASSPVAPSLVRNSDMYELGLADIRINKGITKIVQADITDLRSNTNLCGYVAGVVQQIDTTNLFAQFQSTFDLWFEHVKGQLSTDAAGNLQNQIDNMTPTLADYLNFRQNGGTVGTMNFRNRSINEDEIKTSKKNLNYSATSNDGSEVGFLLETTSSGAGRIRPYAGNGSKIDIGMMSYKFKDIFLTDYIASVNGYTKLPNGFIEQWGEVAIPLTLGASYTKLITFPIAFPNKCLGVYPTCDYDGTGDSSAAIASINANAFAQSNQDFMLQCGAVQLSGTGWASGSRNFRIKWRSIGY